jgi:hypothetical protein
MENKERKEEENWKGVIYMVANGFSKADMEAVMETVKREIDSKLNGVKVVSCDVKSIM